MPGPSAIVPAGLEVSGAWRKTPTPPEATHRRPSKKAVPLPALFVAGAMSRRVGLFAGICEPFSTRSSNVRLFEPEALRNAPTPVEFPAPTSAPPELPQGAGVPEPSAEQKVFAPIAASAAR